MDVARPILSVGELLRKGHRVVLGKVSEIQTLSTTTPPGQEGQPDVP